MSEAPSAEKSRPKVIGGFELLEKIGQGGMGAVFRARQVSMDRVVALKVLPPKIAQDPTYIARFLREARASGQLNHPNIVQGIDAGCDQASGLYYFAMEFVDGPTLKQVLKEKERLPEPDVRRIAREMCEALQAAHKSGLVHRDIKPDNILLTSRGAAKLADLGLAKQVEADDDAELTQAGKAVGTPFYMAPEQVRGENDEIDIRTDFYALGATLFHLLTGKPPYQGGTSAEIMAKHLREKVPFAHQQPVGEVSEVFSRLLNELMQKEKEKRPEHPDALLDRLARIEASRSGSRFSTTGPRTPIGGSKGTTGPRKPLGRTTLGLRPVAAPAGEAFETRRKPALPAPVVAGGALALLVLLGFLFLGGGAKPHSAQEPKPAPHKDSPPARETHVAAIDAKTPAPALAPPPEVPGDETDPERTPLDRQWDRAQEYARKNPEAFRQIGERYEKLLLQAKEKTQGELAGAIQAALDENQKRQAAAADGAWLAASAEANEKLQAADYNAALARLNEFKKAFGELKDAERAALEEQVRARGEAQVGAALAAAEKAMQAADWGQAEEALDAAAEVKFAPAKPQLKEARSKLAAAKEEAQAALARASKEAAESWAKALARFDAEALAKGDLEAARKVAAESAQDAALKAALPAEVQALQAVAAAFEKMKEQERKALEALVGREVDWTVKGEKLKGKIREVKAGAVVLDAQMQGATIALPVKLADLPEEERARLAPKTAPADDAERVAAAILRLRKGAEDPPAAQALLEPAKAFPLAERYLRMVGLLKQGETEALAERDWKALEAKADPKPEGGAAEALLAELDAWAKRYAGTDTVKEHTKDLDALRERLKPAPAAASALSDGGFESGKLEGWNGDLELAKVESQGARSGRHALHLVTTHERGAKVERQVTLPAGKTYVLTAWIKLLKVEGTKAPRIFLGGRGNPSMRENLPLEPLGQWQQVSLEFRPGQNTASMGFDLRVKDGKVEFLVDDLTLAPKD
ncbi:MAG: protein kinase [Planctomycetota bacterium]|nr:protein kinase [Planctomycetota bacterium]